MRKIRKLVLCIKSETFLRDYITEGKVYRVNEEYIHQGENHYRGEWEGGRILGIKTRRFVNNGVKQYLKLTK